MRVRLILAVSCAITITAVAWFTSAEPKAELKHWEKVGDGVYRTKASPFSYALLNGHTVLLNDATVPPGATEELGAQAIEAVLLTHHHRDTAAYAHEYRKAKVPVRAPKESADWLTPENVTKFWKDSVPLRNSRTAYFVLPEGIEGIDCTLADGKAFDFGQWRVTPVATPGHSRDHFAYECAQIGRASCREK